MEKKSLQEADVHNVKQILLKNRKVLTIGLKALLGSAAFAASFLIRFEFSIPADYLGVMWLFLPISTGIKLMSVIGFGMTSGMWRYVSIRDLMIIIKVAAVSTVAFIMVDVLLVTAYATPRSIYVLDLILTIFFFAGIKCSIRIFREMFRPVGPTRGGKRVLIIGAGDAGEIALRQLTQSDHAHHTVVGFLDDDPAKLGMSIHGYSVLGPVSSAAKFVAEYDVGTVVIAIAGKSKAFIRGVVDSCAGRNVEFRLLPTFKDLMTGQYGVDRIRPVTLEDLLGRDPVVLDRPGVEADLGGKCVLVTGAGGSIGSELSRQIAGFRPARLVLLDIAESPLFEIDRELTGRYPDLLIHAVLADVKDASEVQRAFNLYKPTRVYHAAAYKHVPLMESHPGHAVKNNILGTRNVVRAATGAGVKRFVMISTDKAVKPVSIMGATKRVCERIVISANGNGTCFSAVRFGNVLGSNGSVVPSFRKQIEAGGPVTVTHPDVTRYFMTIPEAVELVLHAGTIAEPGDLFVLDMGQPVKIMTLARSIIELSGFKPDVDIEIKITGLRPGEKLVEELMDHPEELEPTSVAKVNRLRLPDHAMPVLELDRAIDDLDASAACGDEVALRRKLWALGGGDGMGR